VASRAPCYLLTSMTMPPTPLCAGRRFCAGSSASKGFRCCVTPAVWSPPTAHSPPFAWCPLSRDFVLSTHAVTPRGSFWDLFNNQGSLLSGLSEYPTLLNYSSLIVSCPLSCFVVFRFLPAPAERGYSCISPLTSLLDLPLIREAVFPLSFHRSDILTDI